MNKAINFVMWLAFEYPSVYIEYYRKFLNTLEKKPDDLYSLEELYELWIKWVAEKKINIQKFYKDNNTDSFILWLENKKGGNEHGQI